MGLINVNPDSNNETFLSASKKARSKMRRLALNRCARDNACETEIIQKNKKTVKKDDDQLDLDQPEAP